MQTTQTGLVDIFESLGLGSVSSRTRTVLPPHGVIVLTDVSPRLVVPGETLDSAVADTARISYASLRKVVGERNFTSDGRLLDYLMANQHTSPFERVQFTFSMYLPIFVARQMVRHRTAKLNEQSGRYTVFEEDMFFVPDEATVTPQSRTNKQMREDSGPPIDAAAKFVRELTELNKQCYAKYSEWIETDGVPKELARLGLPVTTYTCWQWTIDLHNLLKFIGLRSDSHAQRETRVYSDAMLEFVRTLAPSTCASWENHIRNALRISQNDLEFMFSCLWRDDREAAINAIYSMHEEATKHFAVNDKRRMERIDKIVQRLIDAADKSGGSD